MPVVMNQVWLSWGWPSQVTGLTESAIEGSVLRAPVRDMEHDPESNDPGEQS